MSYLSSREIEIYNECIKHKYCTDCQVSPAVCLSFINAPCEMKFRTCPVCGRAYTDPPAISRRSESMEICPECGTREAIEDWEQANDNS